VWLKREPQLSEPKFTFRGSPRLLSSVRTADGLGRALPVESTLAIYKAATPAT